MRISSDDAKLIKQFDEIRQKGYYVSSTQLQVVYNRVFERNLPATQCGSCLRKRIQELVDRLNKQEEEDKIEAAKAVLSVFEEEETETTEQNKDKDAIITTTPTSTKAKKTRKQSKRSDSKSTVQ